MIKFLKQLFCKHYSPSWIRNIYGDEINYRNARSEWKCDKCGKYLYHPNLLKTFDTDGL